jgi:hypothetical protein
MIPIDPWERAAECERSRSTAVDPQRRAIMEKLRDLWIALANEKTLMTEADIAEEIEAISRIHAELAVTGESLRC